VRHEFSDPVAVDDGVLEDEKRSRFLSSRVISRQSPTSD